MDSYKENTGKHKKQLPDVLHDLFEKVVAREREQGRIAGRFAYDDDGESVFVYTRTDESAKFFQELSSKLRGMLKPGADIPFPHSLLSDALLTHLAELDSRPPVPAEEKPKTPKKPKEAKEGEGKEKPQLDKEKTLPPETQPKPEPQPENAPQDVHEGAA